MKTNDLIHILSAAGAVKAPRPLAWVALLCLILFSALTFFILGYRADLMALQPSAGFMMKTTFLGAITLWAAYALNQAAKPIGKDTGWPLVGIIMGVLLVGLIAYEWMVVPTDLILAPFRDGATFRTCLISVTLYGLVGMGILIAFLRQFAPGNMKRAALLTGLAAASLGALGYSFHCPADSPTYIAIAYALPECFIIGLAWFIAPRYLRW